MRKKILFIALATVLCISFTSCGNEKTEPVDEFLEYHFGSDNRVFTTSRGTEYVIDYMEKEENAYEPNVVYALYLGNTEPTQKIYDWCTMSIEERKADLRECANMVIDYAKSEGWSNNYYLYININQIYNGQDLVYNYEEDSLYIPDTESIFLAMYEQFGTMYDKDLEELDGGIDFLINNNLAYIKHSEIEYKTPNPSGVEIYEGEFRNFVDFDVYGIY